MAVSAAENNENGGVELMAKLNGVKTLDMVNGEITKVAYDGAEYAKVANDFKDAQTGDLFLHTENGEYYEITIRKSDFYGVPHPVRFVRNDGRESGYMRECDVHPLFRKVSSDSPTLEQRVTALESEVSTLKGEAETPYEPKVGDIVVVTHAAGSTLSNGDVGKITEIDGYSAPYRVTVPNTSNVGNWQRQEDIRLATAEEVAAYEKAQAPKFAVGDYAKVVKSELGNEGKIVQITDDSEGLQMRKANDDIVPADYLGVPVGDTDVYGFAADQLVKATAEEAKWAKLDRKVGEFKKGDIARVIEDVYGKKVGKIFEVKRTNKYIVVCDEGYRYDVAKHVELIAPVEAVLA